MNKQLYNGCSRLLPPFKTKTIAHNVGRKRSCLYEGGGHKAFRFNGHKSPNTSDQKKSTMQLRFAQCSAQLSIAEI